MTDSTHHSRFESAQEDEEQRVTWVLNWLTGTAILFLWGIGLKAWHSGHDLYGQALLLFSLPMMANLLVYYRTGNRRILKAGLLTIVGLLFMFLLASGGENNTGPLWIYVFPPLVFFLTNLRAGTLLMLACVVFAAIVFQFPELPFVFAEYHPDFQLRFFATILFESIFCFVLDFSRRRARNELISMAALYERASRTDELTGLPNRRDMQHSLATEFSRFQRNGHHFSVILADLDHFKRINDTHGHEAGDQILTQFSQLLQQLCRKADLACRWGGEEFLVLLPDTSLLQALVLAERLRHAVAQHRFVYQEDTIPVTMSAGVCSITQSGTLENLLRQADEYLYQAKEQGRNQIIPRVRKNTETEEASPAEGQDSAPGSY